MKRVNEEFYSNIGSNLRNLRKKNGYSQSKLGELCGCTFQMIQKTEKGINRLSLENAITICKEFNCSISEIIGEQKLEVSKEGVRIAKLINNIGEKDVLIILEALDKTKGE